MSPFQGSLEFGLMLSRGVALAILFHAFSVTNDPTARMEWPRRLRLSLRRRLELIPVLPAPQAAPNIARYQEGLRSCCRFHLRQIVLCLYSSALIITN